MNRVPEPNLPKSRSPGLPEGCSDLIDAYKVRAAFQKIYRRFLVRLAALLHDTFVARLDPEVLRTRDEALLRQNISDFLHPILLANPGLEKQLGSSSDLVETLFAVVMANAGNDKT